MQHLVAIAQQAKDEPEQKLLAGKYFLDKHA
jgi:hypothetical protein